MGIVAVHSDPVQVQQVPHGKAWPGRDYKAQHALRLRDHPEKGTKAAWTTEHRQLVEKVTLEMVDAMDAAEKEALVRPLLDAYLAITLEYEELELD